MPKILYLVTEDWFFVSHFLPMARAARSCGLEVVVATNVSAAAERIVAEGIRLIALDVDRGSLGMFAGLRDIGRALRIIQAERPDIVHCIALRPVVLGGLAVKCAGARALVLAPTGLGWLWVGQGAAARVGRAVVRTVIAWWLRGPKTRYVFENHDDPTEFGLDPNAADVAIVGGAGVDPKDYPNVAEPAAPPLRVAVVARMIAPKGIAEAVAATRRARALGAAVELDLYGTPDEANRDSIPEATLRAWSAEPGIHWHGRSNEVARVWREHHAALYLSYYREGVPRSLIEAAAAGRPIVTTDMPGCREVVRDGREGFLVPPGDTEAAARALVKLAADPVLRAQMGAAANARFRERYTEEAVREIIAGLYRSLLQRSPGS
jgi:glycosyltransferase involved in cell wall biosynthesis